MSKGDSVASGMVTPPASWVLRRVDHPEWSKLPAVQISGAVKPASLPGVQEGETSGVEFPSPGRSDLVPRPSAQDPCSRFHFS